MFKITEHEGSKEVYSVPDSELNTDLQINADTKMSFTDFLKTVTEVIKSGAKVLKDAGLDYESVVNQLKEKLEKIIKDLIDLKMNFFEAVLEQIVILIVNMLIDKLVKEIFEE